MGNLGSTFLTAWRANPAGAFCVIEATFPDATRLWSDRCVVSETGAFLPYDDRILQWSEVGYSIMDRDNRLELPQCDFTVADVDRSLGMLFEGSQRNSVRGSAVVLKIGHVDLPYASWVTWFTGVLRDWAIGSDLTYSLHCTVDDMPIRRAFPKVPIVIPDWTFAHEDAVGQPAPIITGKHSSVVQGEDGMLPLLYVDQRRFRYLICIGTCASVDRVYVDGVEATSGWTDETISVGGRTYHVVTFDADQGDAVITADVQGYDEDGDGGGALVEEPVAAFKLVLINHVLGNYRAGLWVTSHARVDDTTFTAASAFFAARSYKVGANLNQAGGDGYEAINDAAYSLEMHVYWLPSGKLAAGVDDPCTTDITPATTLRWDDDRLGDLRLPSSENDLAQITQITSAYCGGRQAQTVVDGAVSSGEAPVERTLIWGPQFVVA